jgi:hypothetical protein
MGARPTYKASVAVNGDGRWHTDLLHQFSHRAQRRFRREIRPDLGIE